MPQLDFFTFPHQYLVAASCFFGLYYFNLLFLFRWIKYFHQNKIFSIFALLTNTQKDAGFDSVIIVDIFLYEVLLWNILWKKNRKKIQRKLFFKVKKIDEALQKWLFWWITQMSAQTTIFSQEKLTMVFLINFCLLIFFFQSLLIFNAEKLMFVYFLLLFGAALVAFYNFVKTTIWLDLQDFLALVFVVEIEAEWTYWFLCDYTLWTIDWCETIELEFMALRCIEHQILKRYRLDYKKKKKPWIPGW